MMVDDFLSCPKNILQDADPRRQAHLMKYILLFPRFYPSIVVLIPHWGHFIIFIFNLIN